MIFELLNSVASIGSMLVSIIVFLNTIRITEKERKITQEKENLVIFSSKIHIFLRDMVDPEKLYDTFALIYSKENFLFEEKYAEIMKLNSSIYYALQEIYLYSPDNDAITEKLINCLQQLCDKAAEINKKFCDDIKCRLNKKSYLYGDKIINVDVTEYYQNYEESVKKIFGYLHILKQSIGKNNHKKNKYLNK